MTRVHLVIAALALVVAGVVPAGTPAHAGQCGVVAGMSQVAEMYDGSGLSEHGWMLHWRGSTTLGSWADPTGLPWTDFDLKNECANPTVGILIYDPLTGRNGPTFEEAVVLAEVNFRAQYPTLGVVYHSLLAGGIDNALCPWGERGTVAASRKHKDFEPRLLAMDDLDLGPDLEVECDEYRDSRGHLSKEGAARAGGTLAVFLTG